MSKILGIVAEYNPFHNGHLYHLNESDNLIAPDYKVCIMSGNFVQRGDTSIIDKWSKARIAIEMGFDLVIELPTVYAISSAENFAYGAIKILSSLSDNAILSFGSESGNIHILKDCAQVLYNEPIEYKTILNRELAKGISFPKARENAMLMYLNDIRKYANVLNNPNNVLGIEYLKAIKKLKSNIIPVTIKRNSVNYNDLEANNEFASATAIRKMIEEDKDVKALLPTFSYNLLINNLKYDKVVYNIAEYEKEIIYTLRKMSLDEIAELSDVTEGLENKIKEAANSCNNIQDLINIIKSKRYTLTRIQRILLYSMLGITKKDVEISKKITPYIRVLGVSNKGKMLLSHLCSKKTKAPIITSVKNFLDSTKDKNLRRLLEIDILASNIYTLGYGYDSKANLDYTEKLIIK